MTAVVFLSSVQGYQLDRLQEVADRLRKERKDLAVTIVSPEESAAPLAAKKLKFGPAVLIDGRLEFVGVPRYRMLLNRIDISVERAKNPPPPEPPAPAPKPATTTPASPAAPPAKPSG